VTGTEEHRGSPPVEPLVPIRFIEAARADLDGLPWVGEELLHVPEPREFAQSKGALRTCGPYWSYRTRTLHSRREVVQGETVEGRLIEVKESHE